MRLMSPGAAASHHHKNGPGDVSIPGRGVGDREDGWMDGRRRLEMLN